MRTACIRLSILSATIGLSTLCLSAQAWDAATQARTWAKQDRDDSFTFFDPTTRMLHTWMRDGGLTGSLPVPKLDEPLDRWVLDSRNNAWIAHGTTFTQVDRTGRSLLKVKLPAEVGDVCWDTKGFVLSYRTPEPYLEKRDSRGAVIWAFGAKPSKGDGPVPMNRRPIVLDDVGNVLMADSNSLNLAIIDGGTGKKLSEVIFSLAGGRPAPALEGSAVDRGPLAVWPGKGVIFATVNASQIPAALRGTMQGLALARLDTARFQLDFLPTGLDESHILVGVLDSDAIFVNPKGGLMLVRIN